MRLHINAGGLDGFFNGVCSFISGEVSEANSNNLINSLSNIINKTNDLCGGVGVLSIGLGYVQTRKEVEESRKIAMDKVKSKTDSFIQMALRVDAAVATMVTSSREEFYQTNPWLRPPIPLSNWDEIWDSVGDTVSICWNGIIEFYSSNIGKMIFGILNREIDSSQIGNTVKDNSYEEYGVTPEDLKTIEDTYGFTEEEAVLLIKTMYLLGKSSGEEPGSAIYVNYVFGSLSTLCELYNSKRWRATTGQPTSWQVENRLLLAGLSEQEILDIRVIINMQHCHYDYEDFEEKGIDVSKSSFYGESHEGMMERSTDKNSDFAHQAVQITAFALGDGMEENGVISLPRIVVDNFNSINFKNAYTNYEISFKGDIDSTRHSKADFQSDVDAINIYERMRTQKDSSICVMANYYQDVTNGNTNRAEEFFNVLGNGDVQIGIMAMDKILKAETFGSRYIQSSNDTESIQRGKEKFVQWIMFEYYGKDYEY